MMFTLRSTSKPPTTCKTLEAHTLSALLRSEPLSHQEGATRRELRPKSAQMGRKLGRGVRQLEPGVDNARLRNESVKVSVGPPPKVVQIWSKSGPISTTIQSNSDQVWLGHFWPKLAECWLSTLALGPDLAKSTLKLGEFSEFDSDMAEVWPKLIRNRTKFGRFRKKWGRRRSAMCSEYGRIPASRSAPKIRSVPGQTWLGR